MSYVDVDIRYKKDIAYNGLNDIAGALRARNAIEREKLELEREKFEFEKKKYLIQ